MLERVGVFFQQSWLSYKALFGWIEPKTYFFVKVINPIFQLIFFCLLAKYCYDPSDITPWVIGNSFLLCIYNSIFGVGSIFMVERYYGTLKMIIATPTNKFIAFFQRGFVHIIDSLITVFIGLSVGALLFNVSFDGVNIPIFLAITLIAMFSAVGFGLFIGSFGLLTTEMNFIMNLFAMMLLAFSGANFPLENLPVFFEKFSDLLPIVRSIEAANLLIDGQSLSIIYNLMLKEIIIGVFYMFFGYVLMRLTEIIAKRRATLDIY
jgi:ABC-2 type transport system permease protein